MTEQVDLDALEARASATAATINGFEVLALIAELRQERERADRYGDALAQTGEDADRYRDALSRAEETIEKVRAEADAYGRQPDVMEPCGAVAQSLLFILTDYDTDVSDRGVGEEHYRERRADAERVWAVFEAHVKESATSPERADIGADSLYVTPTDDEREALVREVSLAHAEAWSDERECAEAPDRIADAVIALGFRRTVQGER